MPISGLVVVLSPSRTERSLAVKALMQDTRIEVGELNGNRLPLVVECASEAENRDVLEMLQALPGVRTVEVAFVGFDEEAESG